MAVTAAWVISGDQGLSSRSKSWDYLKAFLVTGKVVTGMPHGGQCSGALESNPSVHKLPVCLQKAFIFLSLKHNGFWPDCLFSDPQGSSALRPSSNTRITGSWPRLAFSVWVLGSGYKSVNFLYHVCQSCSTVSHASQSVQERLSSGFWWEVLGNDGDASSCRGEVDIFGEWGKFHSCVSAQQKLGYKMFQFRLKLGWRNSQRKMTVGCRERGEAHTVVHSRCLVLQRGLQTE